VTGWVLMVAVSWVTFAAGNRDGEEGGDTEEGEAKKVAGVDERRCSNAEGTRARENKNECHRAQAEAKRGCDATQGIASWCDVRGRSKGEGGVRGASGTRGIRSVRGRLTVHRLTEGDQLQIRRAGFSGLGPYSPQGVASFEAVGGGRGREGDRWQK
jgi:hypothetical protein